MSHTITADYCETCGSTPAEVRERIKDLSRRVVWVGDADDLGESEAIERAIAREVDAHPEWFAHQAGSTSVATLAVLLLALVPVSLVAVFVASLAGAVAGVTA